MLAGELLSIPVGPDAHLKLTLLIKGDNRKKHNSHEWFLQACAAHYDAADFLFMGDTGTIYQPHCIPRMLDFLLDHPEHVACTGNECQNHLHRGTQSDIYAVDIYSAVDSEYT